jgi:hypothetical protein
MVLPVASLAVVTPSPLLFDCARSTSAVITSMPSTDNARSSASE